MPVDALVIDDEADIRELITITLTRMGINCSSAANISAGKNLLAEQQFDLCLTDMKLPDGNGLELVKFVNHQYPGTSIAVITAHGNMESAVEAMKNGAYDFVSKPIDIAHLRNLVSTAVASKLKQAGEKSSSQTGDNDTCKALIGQSKVITSLKQKILKVSRSNAPVWIYGESGTGKELIARLIHENSARANHPFVPVNCGAIASELIDSEFFGHQKGSFTGATANHDGLFRHADKGTLFLDEIAELPAHMQVKLLRCIQEKSIRPVGSNKEVAVDVRILSASHKNLAQEVNSGAFRHDLFYRLNVIRLDAPPLSERIDDIAILANALLRRICERYDQNPLTLSTEATQALLERSYPGNVRELENILERAVALCDDDTIEIQDLHLNESDFTGAEPAASLPADKNQDKQQATEQQQIIAALETTRWNRREAAKLLGLTYRQLRYRIKVYGLEDDDSHAA